LENLKGVVTGSPPGDLMVNWRTLKGFWRQQCEALMALNWIPDRGSSLVKYTKSAGRMPWQWEPKKDAVSCENLWGAANGQ
jgi:hypothetical protein